MAGKISKALVLTIAVLASLSGLSVVQTANAGPNVATSYNLTETYAGGTITFNFSLNLAETPTSPFSGIDIYALSSFSYFYTGTPLNFVPVLAHSTYGQTNLSGNQATLSFYDAQNANYFSVFVTPEFSNVSNAVLNAPDTTYGSQLYVSSQGIPVTIDGTLLSGTATPNTAVPEPASMALLGAGIAGLAAARRRRAG